jgi:hypothetical protein
MKTAASLTGGSARSTGSSAGSWGGRGRITEAPAAVRADALRALERIEALANAILRLGGPGEAAEVKPILDGVREMRALLRADEVPPSA